MDIKRLQSCSVVTKVLPIHRRLYSLLAARAYSVIMFAALFCTLAVKFFHSYRLNCVDTYLSWIAADISVLMGIELVLAISCFLRPRRWVVRSAIGISAIVCTWSVMNAGWLIRTGTQILPTVLLPLFRDPLNTLTVIGVSLVKMPAAAVILLLPSAIALTFFFFVFAKPKPPAYKRKLFVNRIVICVVVTTITAVFACRAKAVRPSAQIASEGLRYNCQLRAVSFLFGNSSRKAETDFANATRKIPTFDQITIAPAQSHQRVNYNVVVIVLEGVQYNYTSLAKPTSNQGSGPPTPYLATLAKQGAEFANARSSLTHTTKVLFGLLTGRFPSASQDLVEAVPSVKPYAGIATILRAGLNYRTVFFQSAKGNFESRPSLVSNLGFDNFFARENYNDPNAFLGYLACDEFTMLEPISDWIQADEKPFFLTVLCSATHDPYEVPEWFATPADEPTERYRQAITYTDKFIAALDAELAGLNLTDKTILCVVGDHGEAFGEHGLLGHERIPFDENLRIPWVIRAPSLVRSATRITEPVSSIDLAPTLLALLGFDVTAFGFEGLNALGTLPAEREVYFCGWIQQGPAGFVKGNRKFIYNPATKMVSVYDLRTDALELNEIEPTGQQSQEIAEQITSWRKRTLFQPDCLQTSEETFFEHWLCRWNKRVSSAKYQPRREN